MVGPITPISPLIQFYVRPVPLGGVGFSIDANTPHLSAEANGTFDDVVQLYGTNGTTPHRLENVHITANGAAGVVVGSPTTIVDNSSLDAVNGYELNFADGSFVDVWQQAPVATSDSGDIYASYNGSTHVVFATSKTDTLLGATALVDGNIAVLVSSGGNEEIIIQSKDGSGTPTHLDLANHWDPNPQNGSICQLADGNLVVTYAQSTQLAGNPIILLHQEIISEYGSVLHDWTNQVLTSPLPQSLILTDPNPTSETTTVPVAANNGGGYLAIYQQQPANSEEIDIARFENGGNNLVSSPVANVPPDVDHHPTGARLADGGFVIAWDDGGVVYARNFHFDSTNTNLLPDDGQLGGGGYVVSPPANPFSPVTDYAPSVAALADGRYAIAWEEIGPNGSYFTSRGAIFDTRTSGVTLTAPPTGADFVGTPFNDTFNGGAGNDTFTPNGGTDTINGGGGFNTVIYNFASTTPNIKHNDDGSWSIFGTGFTDTITNVQVAQFTDKAVALSPITTVPPTSVQQEVLGLYAALYNRAADFPGYSFWVGIDGQQSDSGGVTVANAGTTAVTLNDAQVLGQGFVNTQATFFNQTYASLTDSQFINALYVNIGGNNGDPGGVAYWQNLLQQAEAGGASVQAARAGLVGQFVHDLIGFDTSIRPPGLTDAQWQDALTRQASINDKIAVSLAYLNASQQPSGSILNAHSVGDAGFNASVAVMQGMTSDLTTVSVAITGINNTVAHQDLTLI